MRQETEGWYKCAWPFGVEKITEWFSQEEKLSFFWG